MSRPAKRTVAGLTATGPGETTARPRRVDVFLRMEMETRTPVGGVSRFSGRSAARSSRPYWLVAGDGRTGPGPLILRLDDGLRVLPVFGFEEEARIFSRRAGRDVRGIEPRRLVSLLRGPLRSVELLALDPISDRPADLLDGATSLTRQRFLGSLLGAASAARRGTVDGPRGVPEWGSP